MEKQNQNIRSWDDLIFENRNREYGAYALRQEYANRLMKSVLTSIGLAVAILVVAGWMKSETIINKMIDDPFTFNPEAQPTIKPEIIPPTKQTPPQRSVNRDMVPVAVPTPDPVEPDPEPATTSGTEGTTEGTAGSDTGTSGGATEEDSGPGEVKSNEPFIHVQVMPLYKGGLEGMMKTLKKHMRYPTSARKMGKEGTVYVGFVVSSLGEVKDVKVIKGFDLDCDKEAVRMVERLTEWTPGFQNKMAVNVKMVLPIKFQLDR